MTSTLLGGCMAPTMPVTTMIASMTRSIVAMRMIQRFSVRATTSAGTMPSGSSRFNGFIEYSATGAPRYEQEEIKGEPADEQKPGSDARDGEGTDRPVAQGLRRRIRGSRSLGAIGRTRSGLPWLISRHVDHSFAPGAGRTRRAAGSKRRALRFLD